MEKTEKFLREQGLQWFGYVERMDKKIALVRAKKFVVEGSKRQTKKKIGRNNRKRYAC